MRRPLSRNYASCSETGTCKCCGCLADRNISSDVFLGFFVGDPRIHVFERGRCVVNDDKRISAGGAWLYRQGFFSARCFLNCLFVRKRLSFTLYSFVRSQRDEVAVQSFRHITIPASDVFRFRSKLLKFLSCNSERCALFSEL